MAALHEADCEPQGFEWIEANDVENSVYAFVRRSRDGKNVALAVSNLTPVVRHGYRLGLPAPGRYLERLNTDSSLYGGSNVGNAGAAMSSPVPAHGRAHSLELTLPPLATLIFEWVSS